MHPEPALVLPAGVETPGSDPLIVITRSFAAPRRLVWKCFTEPQHLVRFWGAKEATAPLSAVDLRVGGAWRQVMRFPSGNEYAYTSIYLEIVEPRLLVWRDAPDGARFGDPLGAPSMVTRLALDEAVAGTLLHLEVRFLTVADRDEAVHRGFATTVIEGTEKLVEYLKTLPRKDR